MESRLQIVCFDTIMERRPEIEGTWTADEVAEWNVRWDAAENDYGERILLEAMAESGVYTPKADSPPPSPESEAMAPPVVTEEPTPAPSIRDVGIAGLGTRRSVGPLTGPPAPTGLVRGGKTLRVTRNANLIGTLFNIRDQVKLYHWQTSSFAQHKATDELVKSLDEHIDKFVESYMGTYGRPNIGKTIPVKNLTSQGMKAYLRKTRSYLVKVLPAKVSPQDTDLLAIRDDLMADVDQAMYLFTLA